MRFVLAIVSFVLAFITMGLGLAERTILAGPTEVTASTTKTTTTPVLIIDGSALNAYPHTQTVRLLGSSSQFAAYGRTQDVRAWVGDASFTRITFDRKTGKLVSRVHEGTENQVPDPQGSDLWLDEFSGAAAKSFPVNVPKTVSIIAVSDGTAPAPSKVTLTWPVDNSNPWSGWLFGAGVVFLLLGLFFLLWALMHMRRTRGPRRNQPKMPRLPKQPRYKPSRSRPKAIAAAKGRRSIRRLVAVTPVLVLTSVVLAGCTSVFPSTPAATSTPKPTATAAALPPVAVSEAQLERIVQRVSTVSSAADSTLDSTLIASRFSGPALAERLTNYAVRKKDKTIAPAASIPSGSIVLALPQQGDAWPRTVMAVVRDKSDSTVAPIALILVQDDPRADYKVNYAITLEPKATLPAVAPANVGAAPINPDAKFLVVQAGDVAKDYGDILLKDIASPSYDLFQADGDTFRTQVGLAAKKALIAKLPKTASLTFTNQPGTGQIVALATNDSGALVAVNLQEGETVKPVKAGAAVSWTGAVKALSGKSSSTKGLAATYGDQLLFFVPSATKGGKIVLLGFSQGLIAAKEIK